MGVVSYPQLYKSLVIIRCRNLLSRKKRAKHQAAHCIINQLLNTIPQQLNEPVKIFKMFECFLLHIYVPEKADS